MCKQRLILRLAGAPIKPRFHFGQHDEWNPNFVTRAKKRRERGISLEQVGQMPRARHLPGTGRSAGSCREQSSFPLVGVNLTLGGNDFVESRVWYPFADEVREICLY